jgi:hypothetical protein
MLAIFATACRRAILAFTALVVLAMPAPSMAAGAFAIGKCGAYGEAYDYPAAAAARTAALSNARADVPH